MCEAVYLHVYDSYFDDGGSVYEGESFVGHEVCG
jgi:hypothetical protein